MAMNQPTDQTDPHYERYLTELDDGSLFRYAANSAAGSCQFVTRGTAWMKQDDRRSGDLMVLMGRLVQHNRVFLDVARAVVLGCNPHSARGEWEAELFRSAWNILQGEYDDVQSRSGPEPPRYSDVRRPYTRTEKLVVLVTLKSLTTNFIGIGWAAQRAAQELGCSGLLHDLIGK
jgi:hypothetical protein